MDAIKKEAIKVLQHKKKQCVEKLKRIEDLVKGQNKSASAIIRIKQLTKKIRAFNYVIGFLRTDELTQA